MASRKEYEMLFMLNATLGNNFNSSFKSAQNSMTQMQNKILELSRTQSDISAYQKQQSAVEKTQQKLEYLQQEYDNIQREIQETEGYSSSLENALLKKQQQIDKTSASLNEQTDKLNTMGEALNKAGVDTENLTSESKRLKEEEDKLKEKQEEVAESAEELGEKGVNAFSAMSEAIAALGIIDALKDMASAYKECVDVTTEFEYSMSNVEALSGANEDEMEKLTAKAKELGATTHYTATEIADAMGFMGMAGWDAQEMLEGMNGVVALAAASGEDLAQVSDIVTDNLTAFGLTASDTAHFADVLASAATNSNTNVHKMGETFKYAAPAAGALGYTVDDIAVAVGLMANNGIKASMAGTSLRTAFTNLLGGATLTGKAFGEVQIETVNVDGSMKSFSETIEELRYYFDQMTESEKVSNASAISGKRAYAGLLAILNSTDEDYKNLKADIENCAGSAQKMADIKLDNMKGDMYIMTSATDALRNTLGNLWNTELRNVYQEITKIANVIDKFVQQNPALVKGIMTFITVGGTLLGAIVATTAAVKALSLAATVLNASMGGVGLALTAVATIATAATLGVIGYNGALVDGTHTYAEITEAAKSANDAIEESRKVYADTEESTMAASNMADHYISKLEELEAGGLKTADAQKEYHNYLTLLCDTIPELSDYIDLENDSIEGGTEALRANTEEWKRNAIAQAYQQELADLYATYSDVLLEQEKNEIRLTKATDNLTLAKQKQEDVFDAYQADIDNAVKAANEYNETYFASADYTQFLTKSVDEWDREISNAEKDVWAAEDAVDAVNKAIKEDVEAVANAENEIGLAEEAVNNLSGAEKDAVITTEDYSEEIESLGGVLTDYTEWIGALEEAYGKAYDSAYNSIKGQYQLLDEVAEIAPQSIDKVTESIEKQTEYWNKYNNNLDLLRGKTDSIQGLSGFLTHYTDGSEKSVNMIAGLATATDEEIAKLVESYNELEESQRGIAENAAEIETGYSDVLDQFAEDVAEDIEALNLSDEAEQSAQATMDAFIDTIYANAGGVTAAYRSIIISAQRALNSFTGPVAVKGEGYEGYGITPYADGTDNASAGLALVGEQGPELVYMRGGETVVTASETAKKMGGVFNLPITFNVSGGNSSDIESVLEQYADSFVERVREAINDITADNARRAYA